MYTSDFNMLDLLTNATAFLTVAFFSASYFLWCSCLMAVGGLYDFAIWHVYPFLCVLQVELEYFVLPPEEAAPYAETATSGSPTPCLYAISRSSTYCRSDYTVDPDFLSGNRVHFHQRIRYEEPVEEKVVYRLPSSTTRGVRKETGSDSFGNEESTESDDQVANEWEHDHMDVDEVDPLDDPMDIEPWNWNLGWRSGNEQFNFEFVLPRANFAAAGVALRGEGIVEEAPMVPNVINDSTPVGDGARDLPVSAPALDIPQVLPAPPQRAAEAVLDNDRGGETEDVLAEILGDLF